MMPGAAVKPASQPESEQSSYFQILKSSALVGGSTVLNIGIGIVRTKAMALLLGVDGVGLMGLYGSIVDLGHSVAGMGVNSSGVRQIAAAAGTNDALRIARTAAVLRRTSIALGIGGAAALAVFSRQVAALTFGDARHAPAVAALGIALFFRLVSGGQGALIQGMRRIADLAKMGVLGALFGTAASILLVYFFRQRGIVPSLIAVAATTIGTSWWYSRKIETPRVSLRASEVKEEAVALLKLGFAFMASSLMLMGVAYFVRILLLHDFGVGAAGLYQSAWTLGGLYVGIILQAMGADFYPRLTAHAEDNAACNRLANEQALIGLVLAAPGVIATLAFAPLVISVFYSAKFAAAVGLLRWICLGVTMQVISWPMGLIILAKGNQKLFFWSELAWTTVYVALTLAAVRAFGLNGAGIGFFGSYIFHALLIYALVSRLSGFRWSAGARRAGALFCSAIAAAFAAFYVLPFALAEAAGIALAAGASLYSLRLLATVLPEDRVPRPFAAAAARLRSL